MGRTVVIVGQTGSGKTTLANHLVGEHGFKRIVTYTTRPKRKGERDGEDYHFISATDFLKKKGRHFFKESTIYRTRYVGEWYYGSVADDYNRQGFGDKVVVLNPIGVMKVPKKAFVVWLDIPNDIAISRALDRGDMKEEVMRRMEDDKRRFEKMRKSGVVNLRITEDMTTEMIAKIITNVLN